MRAILLSALLVLGVIPLASADILPACVADECVTPCAQNACVTDESAGDASSPCQYHTPHDPRYKYVNVSGDVGSSHAQWNSTFYCLSNGRDLNFYDGEFAIANPDVFGAPGTTGYVWLWYGDYYYNACGEDSRITILFKGSDPVFGGPIYPQHCMYNEDFPHPASLLP